MTFERTGSTGRRAAAAVLPALCAAVLTALPGPGLAAQQADDARWLPWLGCWEASPEADAAVADADATLVCVVPDGAAVEIVTANAGAITSRVRVEPDGERRPLYTAGCAGWESAAWSADARRVFLRSELDCRGTQRASSGILAFTPAGEWLDIQAVGVGPTHAVRTRRFRAAPEGAAAAAGIDRPETGVALAVTTARTAAGGRLRAEDVLEASRSVAAEAVEALLVERRQRFYLDAKTLIGLADAGVADAVIDVMVALDNPGVFTLDADTRTTAFRPRPGYDPTTVRDPFAFPGSDPYYDPYGYYRRNPHYYGMFGYGDRYGWYGGRPGQVIVVRDQRSSGKVIRGKGYTRNPDASATAGGTGAGATTPRASSQPARGASQPAAGSRSGGGSSSGSSSGERKAKPRDQSGGS
jgi:hypothetical protein